jgi:hypothetical protein
VYVEEILYNVQEKQSLVLVEPAVRIKTGTDEHSTHTNVTAAVSITHNPDLYIYAKGMMNRLFAAGSWRISIFSET